MPLESIDADFRVPGLLVRWLTVGTPRTSKALTVIAS